MNENEGKVDAKEIKRLINNPMSNVDIIKRLGGRTKVLMYDEFKKKIRYAGGRDETLG